MKILIDICHPAHVHLFKNFIHAMEDRGHETIVTVKNDPGILAILHHEKIGYTVIGSRQDRIFLKAVMQFVFSWRVFKLARKHRIDVAVGTSHSIAHASRFLPFKSFVFNEDDASVVPLFAKLTYPFADCIVTPACLTFEQHGARHKIYPGYHELAYLHPNNFTPDAEVLNKLRVTESERYFIVRFNAFKAHHDVGVAGITNKRKLIEALNRHGKVFITSERDLSAEFRQYKIRIAPEDMHSALYFATMFVGDSQTMTAEAAVLGTPAIRCNSFVRKLAYLDELQDQFGLTLGFRPDEEEQMLVEIDRLLRDKNLKEHWREKRRKLLGQMVDLTEWMINLVEASRRTSHAADVSFLPGIDSGLIAAKKSI